MNHGTGEQNPRSIFYPQYYCLSFPILLKLNSLTNKLNFMSTTYTKLAERVTPHLKAYKEDLTKHDYKTLVTDQYNGQFLYGYRETGTDLVLLPDSLTAFYKPAYLEKIESLPIDEACQKLKDDIFGSLIYVTYEGKATIEILYFDGKQFKTIDRKRAELIMLNHIDKLCSKLRQLNINTQQYYKLKLF